MSPRSCSLLVAVASLYAQGNPADLAAQYQAQLRGGTPSPQQILANLNNLSLGIRQGDWANPHTRLGVTQGVQGYLNLLRGNPRLAGDRQIGLGLSGLYRQLGGLQFGGPYSGWVDPFGAWGNYRTSFLLLNQLQTQFPQDQQIRNDLGLARRAIEVIEAKIPELPRLDWASLDAPAQQDYDDVIQRYISVSAAASSAEVTAETMRRSMADQGLAARPETVAALTRMKLKLEEAKRLIEQRRFSQARERLDSTDAEARKILKSLGA